MEWKLLSGSALFRTSAAVCWGLAVLLVHAVILVMTRDPLGMVADPSDSCAAAVGAQIFIFAPPLVAFLAAASSSRDRQPGIQETLFTTPPSSEEFVLGKFLAVITSTLVLLAGVLIAAPLWLHYAEGHAARALPFWLQASQWWMPLLYVSCLGYTAGLLLPGASGGALVFFYWVGMLAAARYVSVAFLPIAIYLSGGYLAAGMGVVFLAAAFYRRERRGRHLEQSAPIACLGIFLCVGGVVMLSRAIRSYHTPPFHRDPSMAALNREQATAGKLIPPFRVIDNRGRVLTETSIRGQATVMVFVRASPPSMLVLAAPMIRALIYGNEHSGRPPVRLVLVVLTRDPGESAAIGQDIAPGIPVVSCYAQLQAPLQGLPKMLGFAWPHEPGGLIVPAMVAVIDGAGRYMGYRPIYEIINPPAMLALIQGRQSNDAISPERAAEAEQDSAVKFFQALAEVDGSKAHSDRARKDGGTG